MSLTALKVDAIARILLSETIGESQKAKAELRRLMEEPEEVKRETETSRIHKLLAQVGVPAHTAGYRYLMMAIQEAVADPLVLLNTTRPEGLLTRIAEKLQAKSWYSVERGMRQCIESAWTYGNDAFQREHFPVVSPTTMVPTLLEFISRCANIIRLQMEEE